MDQIVFFVYTFLIYVFRFDLAKLFIIMFITKRTFAKEGR